MTQEKGSCGAFCNIYNGVQYFFNFELFHQMMINQTKVRNMFKKFLHVLKRLKFTNLIK